MKDELKPVPEEGRATYLMAMTPYYESAKFHIDVMVEARMISVREGFLRKGRLLSHITGIDVGLFAPNAEAVVGSNEAPAGPLEAKSRSAPYAPSANLTGPIPGNLPIRGAAIIPVVDDQDFCSARTIAASLSNAIKPVIVGKMARALGIFGVTSEDNEWGFYLPLDQNNVKVNDNWRYSKKSRAILTTALLAYIPRKEAASKKTRAGEIIAEVVAETPGFPLAKPPEPQTIAPTPAPN